MLLMKSIDSWELRTDDLPHMNLLPCCLPFKDPLGLPRKCEKVHGIAYITVHLILKVR